MLQKIKEGKVVFGKDEKTVPSVRTNLFENSTQVMKSVDFSYAQTAANDFNQIFDGKKVFDNPKNYKDIGSIVKYLTNEDDVVLDYFAGTFTTAHAVIESNFVEGTNRKYICVQLPEPVNEKKHSGKNAMSEGLNTIFDIGKSRIDRVISNYSGNTSGSQLEISNTKLTQSSLGYKVFKLDSSNFSLWDGENAIDPDQLENQLRLYADHVKADRSQQDILYEVLLKTGYPLTAKAEEQSFGKLKAFNVENGELVVCLADKLNQSGLRSLIEAEPRQVICLDSAFQHNDQLKTNTVLEMKSHGITFHTV